MPDPSKENKTYLQHLYADVPFHEIMGKDISSLNESELQALLKTTRAQRVSPAVRKANKSSAAKQLSGKIPKNVKATESLSHLL